MTPSVSREAALELTEAAKYYADNGGKAVALALIHEVEAAIDLLCERPELGAFWRHRRRLPLRRFPYSIIYYISGDSLRVIALAHHRRRPQLWSRRS